MALWLQGKEKGMWGKASFRRGLVGTASVILVGFSNLNGLMVEELPSWEQGDEDLPFWGLRGWFAAWILSLVHGFKPGESKVGTEKKNQSGAGKQNGNLREYGQSPGVVPRSQKAHDAE